jgi:hypothetical protein
MGFSQLVNDVIHLLFAERVQGTAISYGHTKEDVPYSIYQYRVGGDNYQTWSSDIYEEIGSKRTILYWPESPLIGYVERDISKGLVLIAFGAMGIAIRYAWGRTNSGG